MKCSHAGGTIALSAALLAGCAGPQQPLNASTNAMPQAAARAQYTLLYSFGATSADGQEPKAALIAFNGLLYGTTYAGGANGDGTVFSVNPNGIESVQYSFRGGNDGANPSASLHAVKDVVYGTTEYGGGHDLNAGTVFKLDTDGREKVLHTFGPTPDGLYPVASLIDLKGRLYGTTYRGGENPACYSSCGTVYSISMSGKERVLHSFAAYSDGTNPAANLVNLNGTLYGTTQYGMGTGGEGGGYGTIFSIPPSGTEKVLYNSPGGTGATIFLAGLINVNGTLYGTSAYGGANGPGTVFTITTSGSLTILHSFGSGKDGGNPYAPLLDVNGTLYGTTLAGGKYGHGTVFRMNLTGKEKVLHSFGYATDGEAPVAGLLEVDGTLYGTTSAGGEYGHGTIFTLTP